MGTLASALSAATLALVLAAAGCQSEDPGTGLNPRPEELPSAAAGPASSAPPEAADLSLDPCGGDPMLAGCAVPGNDVGDSSGAPAPEEPIDLDEGGEDAGTGALGLDAGALRATDAGAP